jgi:hypothetical protein
MGRRSSIAKPRPSAIDGFEPAIRELLAESPRIPATVIAERVGWARSMTVMKDRVRELRLVVAAPGSLPAHRVSGTGKTQLSIGLGIRACQAGHRVVFATAAEWVIRLGEAHAAGRPHAEFTRLGRYRLLVIDEVGYIAFEAEAANLFFQLVSSRYERASVIVTSNEPFGRWGETFGDASVAGAMIDELVHRAEVINLKGDANGSRTATSGGCLQTTLRNRTRRKGSQRVDRSRGVKSGAPLTTSSNQVSGRCCLAAACMASSNSSAPTGVRRRPANRQRPPSCSPEVHDVSQRSVMIGLPTCATTGSSRRGRLNPLTRAARGGG